MAQQAQVADELERISKKHTHSQHINKLFKNVTGEVEIAQHCTACITRCTRYLARGAFAQPLLDVTKMRKRCHTLWHRTYITHAHHTLGGKSETSLVDIIQVAWCYLLVCQSPDLLSTHRCRSKEAALELQDALRRMQLDWNRSGAEITRQWAVRVHDLRKRFAVAVVRGLSGFEVKDDIYSARGLGETTTMSFNELDVHATYENRSKTIEEKEADTSYQDILSKEEAPKSRRTLKASLFVTLGARSFFSAQTHLALVAQHKEHTELWSNQRLQNSSFFSHAAELCSYAITSETEKRMRELYILRSLPSGSREMMLRHTYCKWDSISSDNLARDELGEKHMKRLMEEAQKPCKDMFGIRDLLHHEDITHHLHHKMKWETVHDTWLMVLWHRLILNEVQVPFLSRYVVLEQQLAQRKHMYSHENRFMFGSMPRPPLMLEACGRWFVSIVEESETYDYPLWLVPCDTFRDALVCWAAFFLTQRGGCTKEGKDMSRPLLALLDMKTVVAQKWCVLRDENDDMQSEEARGIGSV